MERGRIQGKILILEQKLPFMNKCWLNQLILCCKRLQKINRIKQKKSPWHLIAQGILTQKVFTKISSSQNQLVILFFSLEKELTFLPGGIFYQCVFLEKKTHRAPHYKELLSPPPPFFLLKHEFFGCVVELTSTVFMVQFLKCHTAQRSHQKVLVGVSKTELPPRHPQLAVQGGTRAGGVTAP